MTRDLLYDVITIRVSRMEQEHFKAYNEKVRCLRAQDYDTAGKFRDTERQLKFQIDRCKKMLKLKDKIK